MSTKTFHLPDLAPANSELCDIVGTLPAVRPTRLQTYVTDRFSGAKGPAWLDGMRIDEAYGTAFQLGILDCLGPAGSRGQFDQLMVDEIEEAGFAIASGGEQAAIDRLQMTANEAMSRPRINMADPGQVFGSLHEWTFSSSQAGPIARLLDDVILQHLPCGTRARPGTKAVPPRLHTAMTLAVASGVKKSDLVAILRFHGLIPKGCSHDKHPFDRAQGEEIVRRMAAAVPAGSVASYLGCRPQLATVLMTNGLIQRLGRCGHDPAITADRAVDLVEKSVLDRFLHTILHRAETLDPSVECQGLLTLDRAALHQDWPVDRIILMIQRRVIRKVYRRRDIPGLAGLLIDLPNDLWPIFSVPPWADSICFDDAAHRFDDMLDARELLTLAKEDGSPMLRGAIDPYERRRNTPAFCRKSFDRFVRRHVTSNALAAAAELMPHEIVGQLEKRGIKPILSASNYRPAIYRRDAV